MYLAIKILFKVITMGTIREGEKVVHANQNQAQQYFMRFYFMWLIYGWSWKNYVMNDHVRFIAEVTPDGTFFGRSLIRSHFAISEPEDIDKIIDMVGFVGQYNPSLKSVDILHTTNDISVKEFRQLYKKHGGKERW